MKLLLLFLLLGAALAKPLGGNRKEPARPDLQAQSSVLEAPESSAQNAQRDIETVVEVATEERSEEGIESTTSGLQEFRMNEIESTSELQAEDVTTEISASFRQGVTDAPDDEEAAESTSLSARDAEVDESTSAPHSAIDRVDSATDLEFIDATTEKSFETTNSVISVANRFREEPTDEVNDEVLPEVTTTDSLFDQDTTVADPFVYKTEKPQSIEQMFEEAAPIEVVEVKIKSPDEDIIPKDSGLIRIVEIGQSNVPEEKSKAAESTREAEQEESEREAATTELVTNVRDEEGEEAESVSSSVSKDKKKPDSKVQAVDSNYWLKMQDDSEREAERKDEVEAESYSKVDEREVQPAATSQVSKIEKEIAKVAQKYGLQSVQDSSKQASSISIGVPKEESLYLGVEKDDEFEGSNSLQRRLGERARRRQQNRF